MVTFALAAAGSPAHHTAYSFVRCLGAIEPRSIHPERTVESNVCVAVESAAEGGNKMSALDGTSESTRLSLKGVLAP